jgi:hypothetical protein
MKPDSERMFAEGKEGAVAAFFLLSIIRPRAIEFVRADVFFYGQLLVFRVGVGAEGAVYSLFRSPGL